jgi:hypothetical protein
MNTTTFHVNPYTSMAPGSQHLPSNVIEGYKPVSRNNEQVQNAFIDTYEWNHLDTNTVCASPDPPGTQWTDRATGPFHEWATVLPGHICVSRKDRAVNFRQKMVAETAAPVIACAQCKGVYQDDQYFFAGVCRSKNVRFYDDGEGPKTDEMFTMFIGGLVTLLNNGSDAIHPGDVVEWTFADSLGQAPFQNPKGPRRIQVRGIMSKNGSNSLRRAFGQARSFAKKGEWFDILIGSTSM